MVVHEQHPLDALHSDLAQVVEHAAITEVNEQPGITIPEHINVTSAHTVD
jgi:hypothetical protein